MGGGLFNNAGQIVLNDDTIANNVVATDGSAVYNYAVSSGELNSPGLVTLANTILVGKLDGSDRNVAVNDGTNAIFTATMNGNKPTNFISSLVKNLGGSLNGSVTTVSSPTVIFGHNQLADNGGLTETILPIGTSPTIGTGASTLGPTLDNAPPDPTKWTTDTSVFADQNSSDAVTSKGALQLQNGAYLTTRNQFDPSAQAIEITGSFQFDPTQADALHVITRSDGTPDGSGSGEVANGIAFLASDLTNTLSITGLGDASVSGGTAVPFAITPNHTYLFVVTDDGTNLSLTMTDQAAPGDTATVTATSGPGLDTNFVTIHNDHASEGNSTTGLLQNLKISAVPGGAPLLFDTFANYSVSATDQRGQERPLSGLIDVGSAQKQVEVLPPIQTQTGIYETPADLQPGSFTDSSNAGPWTVTVAWGDGSANTTFQVTSQGSLGSRQHAYANIGQFQFVVTVTNANHESSQSTTPGIVVVNQATPVVTVSDGGGQFTDSDFPATGTITGATGEPGSTLEGVGLTFTYYVGSAVNSSPLSAAPTTVRYVYRPGLVSREPGLFAE